MLEFALKLFDNPPSKPKEKEPVSFKLKLLGVYRIDKKKRLLEDRATRDAFADEFEGVAHPVELLGLLHEPLVYLLESKRLGGRVLVVPHTLHGKLKGNLPFFDVCFVYREGWRIANVRYLGRAKHEKHRKGLPKGEKEGSNC